MVSLGENLGKTACHFHQPTIAENSDKCQRKKTSRKDLQLFHDILILLRSTCLNFTARNIKKKSAEF
jgi:hypothetical protein